MLILYWKRKPVHAHSVLENSDLTLACVHMLLCTVPTKNDELYAPCAECLRDYVATWGTLRLKPLRSFSAMAGNLDSESSQS